MINLLKDANVAGKRVLVRFDYNVSVKNGAVADDTRLKETLPTINFLRSDGAKLIIMSHLGRPDGKLVEGMSLKPVAVHLSELLGVEVKMAPDCIGPETEAMAASLKEGEIIMLENLRFHKEEEENDDEFSRQLASLGEVYVNDAFGTVHRAHASVVGVTKYLPGYSGFLLQKEIEMLGNILGNPDKPFIAVLGGAKVSDKIGVISNLSKKADLLLIGGAMQFTFLQAKGMGTGTSLYEKNEEHDAVGMLATGKLVLPVDAVVASSLTSDDIEIVPINGIPATKKGLDIGPETVKLFSDKIKTAKTIVWNGPMGVFETEAFSKGTIAIANAIASSEATTVIGGGDTIAVSHKSGVKQKFTFVSTGGGAMLEFLEGKELPGIVALKSRKA
jgi:phosphoglycerate kinase